MPRSSDQFKEAGDLVPGDLIDVFVPGWRDDRYERPASYVQERVEGVLQLNAKRVDVHFADGDHRELGKHHSVRLSG